MAMELFSSNVHMDGLITFCRINCVINIDQSFIVLGCLGEGVISDQALRMPATNPR